MNTMGPNSMVAFVLVACGLLVMVVSVPAYRPSNSALRVIGTLMLGSGILAVGWMQGTWGP